jgi:hypothetical protein
MLRQVSANLFTDEQPNLQRQKIRKYVASINARTVREVDAHHVAIKQSIRPSAFVKPRIFYTKVKIIRVREYYLSISVRLGGMVCGFGAGLSGCKKQQ